jgi:hypothetical protein
MPPTRELRPIGHGYCTSCIDSLFENQQRTKCPNCRDPVTRRHARPIYFDAIDPKVSATATVVEGLIKMDENAKLISVKKAEEKIRKAAMDLEVGEDTAVREYNQVHFYIKIENVIQNLLLQAVNQFNERIIPNFTKVELQMEEIASLRKDLHAEQREKEKLGARYEKLKILQVDKKKMKDLVIQVGNERDEALLLAERACEETVKLREANDVSIDAMKALEEENERYQGQLQRHMELVSVFVFLFYSDQISDGLVGTRPNGQNVTLETANPGT